MPWIALGFAIILLCWLTLRYARRTGQQTLASVAAWGIFVGVAVAAMGLAAIIIAGVFGGRAG